MEPYYDYLTQIDARVTYLDEIIGTETNMMMAAYLRNIANLYRKAAAELRHNRIADGLAHFEFAQRQFREVYA